MNTSSIVALDIIPDPENNQVFIFQQNNIQQVVDISEDDLNIELGLDFDEYDEDEDEDDEYEEDYEDDDVEDEIIQQLEAVAVDQCPAA
ncbi:unnamed protein product [Rotaria magnacalcarata]|uniref:Uncharacterized protein n=4 Tax=Rotaria magnacalcarata TaxID=392030 RepID=A0A816Y951_9BILA|nr:unnamed protein product [Rotaria magnacalcarata]CAF2146024.1 unnamed protein product [Rotaria magnacalcarata]CAF2156346.1 unnamed protein product [Rotaria magnacalcarata]CAF4487726.1 unnamed protein product [Rotaria magnacalcarata]CAF5169154.1 unnamed protein product [Rotaria magnacalcarata]